MEFRDELHEVFHDYFEYLFIPGMHPKHDATARETIYRKSVALTLGIHHWMHKKIMDVTKEKCEKLSR